MKLHTFILATTTLFFLLAAPIAAENLNSPNYTLINPELNSIAGTSASANYKVLTQGGSGIGFGQISSSLYKIGSGQGYTFMANVPKITCFETNSTSGTTTCIDLPAANGMVGECGENGCYDRAMLQIDMQANPTDTVFSIQMSSDNWTTVFIVDGTTHALKQYTSKTINDYKSKAQWEGTPWNSFNIINLRPGVTYKARVTALQGDFSESSTSPEKQATTSLPTLSFDIDIGTDINAESDSPYFASIGVLTPETALMQTSQQIKLDMATNAQSGISVYVTDSFGGLRSSSTSYTLQSASEDLANPASGDGFGLQNSDTAQASSSKGYAVSGSTYALTSNNVGAISSSSQTIIACSLILSSGTCGVNAPTWVTGGKALYTIGARATLNAPAVNDYEDALTFTVTGGW